MTAFASLYVPDELGQAVSGRAWLAAMLETERALARAGALAGAVPDDAASVIARVPPTPGTSHVDARSGTSSRWPYRLRTAAAPLAPQPGMPG